MAITSKIIPKTNIFLEQANPLVRTIETEFFVGNNVLETFNVRTNLVLSPILTVDQDLNNLQLDNPVLVDVNNFTIVFKPLAIGEPVEIQNYALPTYLEIINSQQIRSQFSFDFEELE